jgi:protein phosphatase
MAAIHPGDFPSHSRSDTGLVRDRNEDSWTDFISGKCRTWAVADGMGGHKAGDEASWRALRAFEDSSGSMEERIRHADAVLHAEMAKNSLLHGMGTTLVALVMGPLYGDEHGDLYALLAWVGDSRCYRLRDGDLDQLTRDHGVGQLLTRCLGGHEKGCEVDQEMLHVQSGDHYLLCSDGLTDMVKDVDIKRVMKSSRPVAKRVQELIRLACEKGGKDNITVQIVEVP